MIVFLDGFQEVAASGQPFGDTDRLTKEMRAIFQRSDKVSYLFAGSIEHLMRDLFAPNDRALSQFGSFRHLTPITRSDWQHGLGERFEKGACTIDSATLLRLVELGRVHPRSTMLIAPAALERIRLTRHAQTIAMRIAREQRLYPGLNASQTQRALRALELIGVAERSARGAWTITDPLLGRYLADLPGA
jgi:hypothetical protein